VKASYHPLVGVADHESETSVHLRDASFPFEDSGRPKRAALSV
jgi:hypothetical protein